MTSRNHALSRVLGDMSAIYRYHGTEDRFRALAYAKAARIVDGLQEDIAVYIRNGTLEELPGIGESIAEKIMEYVQTGKIRKYDELSKSVPVELLDLMNVSGFGPQSLKQIHAELGIKTREQLIRALEDGRISKLKRFGARKVENMMRGLKLYKQTEERILLWDAMLIGDRITADLGQLKEVKRMAVAGSVRRGRETIGDIDILVACRPADRRKVVQAFTLLPDRKIQLSRGDTRASIIIGDQQRQVDLRVVNETEWGSALLYLTGSKEHNVALRSMAKDKGLKINEYGLFRLIDDKRLAGQSEEDMYSHLGLAYIPPEMREMHGELDLAASDHIPKLIDPKDIKGDMQMHSTWSDGQMDIRELADFVQRTYGYQYIVLTDHSKSSRIAGGMDEKGFEKQSREIDQVNSKLGQPFVRKGVEVDILPDGSLDLSDTCLAKMEWVCASIHSGFTHDNTQRLIQACRNPYVNCIGHPSGRLIGKREAYGVDWDQLFKVAAQTGTAIEINAQPDRMDLTDALARQALQAGVRLVISTDSHAAAHYDFMRLGVTIARRAWCRKEDVLNTRPWKDLEAFVQKKR